MRADDTTSVLIITQFFPPESMGGAHRWEKLAAHMDDRMEPHVLCTQPTFPYGEFERRCELLSRERMNGLPVTRLFTYQPLRDMTLARLLNYGIFSFLSSLYVLCTFWRYDCVVTMSAPHTTFIPGLVAKVTGRKWVIDIFDLWIDNAADLGYVDEGSIPYRAVSALERLSFAESDAIFVISQTMAEYYEEKYPTVGFDVHVIPFGVDRDLFSPDVEPTVSTDIIYTGNLGAGQAFVPFLEGFAQLDGKPELTIVGDGERRAELERLVEELGVSDRVSFLGYVDRDEIPGLLAGATVSIVPLKTEHQLDYARPTKLLETMAVGTPYIASEVKEIVKVARQYNTGVALVNNSEIISENMSTMLNSPQDRQQMASNGIQVISQEHDWDTIGEFVSDKMAT